MCAKVMLNIIGSSHHAHLWSILAGDLDVYEFEKKKLNNILMCATFSFSSFYREFVPIL